MRKKTGSIEIARQPRRSGVAGLYSVPRLEEVAADQSKAWALDARTVRVLSTTPVGALVSKLCQLIDSSIDGARSKAAAVEGPASSVGGSTGSLGADDVITLDEAAAILRMPRERLIRNKARYPFVKQVSRKHFVCVRSATLHWLASRPNSVRGT